jgi:hypothetical protein
MFGESRPKPTKDVAPIEEEMFGGCRDSSVGIATGYGLGGPGIESRWGAIFFAHVQTIPGDHPVSCTMGIGSFPGVNRPGRGADHTPPSSAEVTSIHPVGLFRPVTGLL